MRKLLVPYDGSQSAERALRHALELAAALDKAELHLVHVHESVLSYGRAAAYIPAGELEADMHKKSEALLKPALERVAAAGVPHRSAVLHGAPAQAIVGYAEDHGCDGIVMGTQGTGAISTLLLGSVATKVMHLAKVPVTLVK
jgi:nucleotide-binding universal stress UspA family protein